MSQENDNQFYPQEYRGTVIAVGDIARVVDLTASDLEGKPIPKSHFAIKLKNGQQYLNERVGKWIENHNGEGITMSIDLPFPEKPANFVITLSSQINPEDLISFDAKNY